MRIFPRTLFLFAILTCVAPLVGSLVTNVTDVKTAVQEPTTVAVPNRPTPPAQPPSAIPEFAAIGLLLASKQGAIIGSAVTSDSPGPNLLHFQLFKQPGDSSNPINSIEMHRDGTIYISYTDTRSPTWYNSYDAIDNAAGHNTAIAAGAGQMVLFSTLKQNNVNEGTWQRNADAFPSGKGPAPRWFKIQIPTRSGDPDRPPIPLFDPSGWLRFLTSTGSVTEINKLIPHETTTLPDAFGYCYNDHFDTSSVFTFNDPPEWATLLPESNQGREFGQRKYLPDQPIDAPLNHYVGWNELVGVMQADPTKGLDILKWRGHPNSDDYGSVPMPWISADVQGLVPNSFLSGQDYAGDHANPPPGYFLGNPQPRAPEGCGTFRAENALCDDWVVYFRPDPEYHFLLARAFPSSGNREASEANFDSDHLGSLENEIEQGMLPVGWRPEPGDRAFISGRWIIDCGENWHAELHPMEGIATSHTDWANSPDSIDGRQVVTSLLVTGAWLGGVMEFDLWPPPRSSPGAHLRWTRETDTELVTGLTVEQQAQPLDNPNHIHVTVRSTAGRAALGTGGHNDVYYNYSRRLVTRYRLWWGLAPTAIPNPA